MVIGFNECRADAIVTTGCYTTAQIHGVAEQTVTQDALQFLRDFDLRFRRLVRVQDWRLLLLYLSVCLPVSRYHEKGNQFCDGENDRRKRRMSEDTGR